MTRWNLKISKTPSLLERVHEKFTIDMCICLVLCGTGIINNYAVIDGLLRERFKQ